MTPGDWLNFNQFYYFWVISRTGGVTQASRALRTSQSNLSAQLKLLEESLGFPLFERTGRTLSLTERGKIARDYADGIFQSSQEMVAVLRGKAPEDRKSVVRIGAISSLSKNLQYEFIRPLLREESVKLVIVEGSLRDLIRQLQDHQLDVVVSNVSARAESTPEVYNHHLGAISVFAVGAPSFKRMRTGFPGSLRQCPVLLPGQSARYRRDLEGWLNRNEIQPDVRAEVEDMALLRILALSGEAIAFVPEIVVRDELVQGTLIRIKRLAGISENFYAITATRKFPNPHVEAVVRTLSRTLLR